MSTIVDTSRYNSQRARNLSLVDWPRAKAEGGISKAILRAMAGFDEADPFFVSDLHATDELELDPGAYLVYKPFQDWKLQAATQWHFLKSAGFTENGGRTIASDFERWPIDDRGAVYAYISDLSSKSGEPVEIYTSPGWWNAFIGYQSWAKDFPLWVAFWNLNAWAPMLPRGFLSWWRWQYRQDGSLPGFTGWVNLSRENKDPSSDDFQPIYHGVVTAYHLNVRKGPSMSWPVLRVIDRYSAVEVYDELGQWLKISRPQELPEAWIHSAYVRVI